MRFFYSDHHDLSLPEGHRFPGHKYGLLRRMLVEQGIISTDMLMQGEPADLDRVMLAHDADYVHAIENGTIDAAAMRRIGFPWSPGIAVRARATIGGALKAAQTALEIGISGQLAGGTHHAHRGFGSGYCIYNDFAVVALSLLTDKRVHRVAIVDLDVHQGDGNAAILQDNPDIFVLSVHGEKNFPFRKFPSTLDIALPDGVEDKAYCEALAPALEAVWNFSPDIILYQAGVDPLKEDKLGRMALSFAGLMQRDRMVLAGASSRGIPISMGIGGGYADPIELSVTAYANTYRVAREVYQW